MWAFDHAFVETCAALLREHDLWRGIVVALAETNFAKALLFAPFLLIAWYARPASRPKVLLTCASCAAALILVWCFTSSFLRPRPISPISGCELAARIFGPYFHERPEYVHWGCFPSDHAAYLTALALGLWRISRRVGIACLVVISLNSFCRVAAGLHYPSDVIAGMAAGLFSHGILFHLMRRWEGPLTSAPTRWIDNCLLIQGVLAFAIVEMSVMFHDLRVLDRLIFGE